jgi:hypothetical protein
MKFSGAGEDGPYGIWQVEICDCHHESGREELDRLFNFLGAVAISIQDSDLPRIFDRFFTAAIRQSPDAYAPFVTKIPAGEWFAACNRIGSAMMKSKAAPMTSDEASYVRKQQDAEALQFMKRAGVKDLGNWQGHEPDGSGRNAPCEIKFASKTKAPMSRRLSARGPFCMEGHLEPFPRLSTNQTPLKFWIGRPFPQNSFFLDDISMGGAYLLALFCDVNAAFLDFCHSKQASIDHGSGSPGIFSLRLPPIHYPKIPSKPARG